MCGILGTTNKQLHLDSALQSIIHRGPDGKRIQVLNDCQLGFVRLSIQDLSDNAMQPMSTSDKKIHIVFNGEIYGYESLKRDLLERGYVFKTTGDTEVLIYAYQEYGESFIDKVDGIFAIAIVDENIKKMFLYRDRSGIKPLMYYWDGENISFCSEIKELISLYGESHFHRDDTAIYDYFTYRYIPEPKTLYTEIRKLLPATKLIFDLNTRKITQEKYWELKVNSSVSGSGLSKEELYQQTRDIISDAVKKQTISDVKIGTFLSGGIDSSIVTYELVNSQKDFSAFSIGFQVDNQKEIDYDETPMVKILEKKLGIKVNYSTFSRDTLCEMESKVKEWFDEPFCDSSCYPTYYVSRVAKEDNTIVILTGDGGDEVFGGYTRYKDVSANSMMGNMFKFYTILKEGLLTKDSIFEEWNDFLAEFSRNTYILGNSKKKYLSFLNIDKDYDDLWYFKQFDNPELPPMTRGQFIDFNTYLPSDILTKVDRVSMQNSIETRVPFLAKEVIEYAFGLSQEERCPNGELKGILKKSYEGLIPDEILYKKKKGFSYPASYLATSHIPERAVQWNKYWK